MSYDAVSRHRSMALDHVRNAAYLRAMQPIIHRESVVLDAGAGLGVLGIAAAKLGARRVYLLEPAPVALLAEEIARANGVADRVVVLRGRIEELDLPEQVDVITSVFTGNSLFSEDLLPSLYRARDRWLKPEGYMIPDAAELVVAPVCAERFNDENVLPWSQPCIGVDLSSARRFAVNEIYGANRSGLPPTQLAEPTALVSLDLGHTMQDACDAESTLSVTQSGVCHAICVWIRLRLGDETLSSDPQSPEVHWTPQLFPVYPAIPVDAGDEMFIRMQRPAFGDWSWIVRVGREERRHSEFLSRPMTPSEFRGRAGSARPALNALGRAMAWALAQISDGVTNTELALGLVQNFAEAFPGLDEANVFVQRIIRHYAEFPKR